MIQFLPPIFGPLMKGNDSLSVGWYLWCVKTDASKVPWSLKVTPLCGFYWFWVFQKNWRISKRLNEFSKWVGNMPNKFILFISIFFRVLWIVKVHCIIGRFNNVELLGENHLKHNFRAHKSLLWTEGNLHLSWKIAYTTSLAGRS